MWQGLEEMGFQGGSIAEPAMGIGHFFGLMPSSIAAQSNRLLGVEFDGLTARIAQQLYQSADVRHQGFEATAIGEGAVDLFISNVPFGSIETSDAGSRELTNLRAPIHDFFFSKAIRKVRPGGLVVFITSRFSMDKVNGKFRKDWQQHADLVGMVRLPFTAFKGSSNTEVVTDIVVLQRRPEGAEPAGPAFTGTGQSPVKGNRINEYYLEHPEHVLGTQAATGTMHGDSQYNVEPDESRPLGEQIVQAFASMQANAAWLDATTDSSSETSERARTTLEQPARESSTQVKDGKVWIVENGELVEYPGFPTDPKGTYRKRVESLTAVRDAATAQVVLETSPTSTEEEVDAGRERLNKAYDAHASKY